MWIVDNFFTHTLKFCIIVIGSTANSHLYHLTVFFLPIQEIISSEFNSVVYFEKFFFSRLSVYEELFNNKDISDEFEQKLAFSFIAE